MGQDESARVINSRLVGVRNAILSTPHNFARTLRPVAVHHLHLVIAAAEFFGHRIAGEKLKVIIAPLLNIAFPLADQTQIDFGKQTIQVHRDPVAVRISGHVDHESFGIVESQPVPGVICWFVRDFPLHRTATAGDWWRHNGRFSLLFGCLLSH